MDSFFSGLVRTAADKEWLQKYGRTYQGTSNLLAYPDSFDPRDIIRCEDQEIRNSCVGHGLSSCGEIAAYLDSGGKLRTQFSRWGAYIWSQMMSGMAGRDSGATIRGAIQAAVKYGFCPEDIWPYPAPNERYTDRVPRGAEEAAAPYQLLGHTPIDGYAPGFEWMNQGKGGLLLGVDWTDGLANGVGDVTLNDARGRSRGGHCFFLWGWLADGRLWMGNSHSRRWGQNGWRPVRPEVVDYWAQRGEIYGTTDLKDVKESRPVIADFGEGM